MVIKANKVIMSDKAVIINPGTQLEKQIEPPRFGSLTLYYQDGKLVSVDKTEKERVV